MQPNHVFFARLAVALAIILAGCHGGVAAELAIPSRPAPKAIPKDVSVQTGPPNCARWTDECVSCTRAATGALPVCSNIGFACQPKAIRCLGAQ